MMAEHPPRSGCLSEVGSSPATSITLLQGLKAQQPEAWCRFVDIYTPLIYGWCRRAGLSAEDAKDVGQDVFRAVASNMARFRRDDPNDSFSGWLWTVTRNKIRDHFRRQHGTVQASGGTGAQQRLAEFPEDFPLSTTGTDHGDDEISVVRRVLPTIQDRFERKNWEAFWRMTVKGEAGKDVAEKLGMSVPAVYQAKYRVLQRIRQELEELLG
jgi:RNA polymerase sigma-70 factor (ECF subfamily)